MDFRTASVAVLFIIVIFPLGMSQDVPDDVVYTEVKKTLINGNEGVLTCRFKGAPHAVYWKKGSDPERAPSIIARSYDEKTGPGYEDGSCDIDENYSLIIKNVTYEDEGRYICRVSTYKGILKHNFTDVTITNIAVKTEANVAVQMGKVGVLPCKILIRPRKVSWVKGVNSTLVTLNPSGGDGDISGPENEGIFNMTEDYSLVINDATLRHEDNYFCEVAEFDTGRIYRDLTALAIYARPTAPFPTIEGCPLEDHTNCIIATDSSLMLTCHVNEYYPDINLFFIHGSKRVESIDTQTSNNTDGTRNKSITISANESKDAYKCTASGIPGLGNNEVSASVRLIQEQRNSLIFTVLLVPIVLCLTVALLTWMRLRKRGKLLLKGKRYMKGHISYVELWKLVEYIIENEETPKLVDLITLLLGEEVSQTITDMQEYYYLKLCRWKDTCDKTSNQRITLYENCCQVRLHETFKQLEEFQQNTSAEIPPSDFEHILWHINEPLNMNKFLTSLGIYIEKRSELSQKKKIVEEAIQKLTIWNPSQLDFLNPVIIISLTMEMLGYCKVDNNFFQIPTEEKDKINIHEIQRFERNLMASHWKKLESIKSSGGSKTAKDLNENKVLCDIPKMLRDWLEDVECSNYDKRRTLQRLSDGFSDEHESPANDHWPSDEELKVIARYLNSASMKSVYDKLHITSPHEKADENQRFEALCQWRTSSSAKEWTSVYGQLRSVLEEVGIPGLLPSRINGPICKVECVDIAFNLLMADVLPVAKALGGNVNRLAANRPVFEPSHLHKGTIGVITHVVESTKEDDSRLVLSRRLRQAGFPLATAWNVLVKQVGYGELYAISDAMRKDVSRHDTDDDDRQIAEERDGLLADKKTSIEMKPFHGESQEEGNKERHHYSELIKMLKLTEEELAALPSHRDLFALFKTWKVRPIFALFNGRTAIINGLLDIRRPDIATSVAEGKFFVREVSRHFIKYSVKKMDENERGRFADAFNLQKEFEEAHGSDDEISKVIHGFLRKWRSEFEPPIVGKEDGVHLIDKLIDNGFIDIARELNVILY